MSGAMSRESVRATALDLNRRGAEAFAAGRLVDASRAWEEAARLLTPAEDDVAPAIWENVGIARYNLGCHAAATRAFLRALDGDLASREQSLRLLVACRRAEGCPGDAARLQAVYDARVAPPPLTADPVETTHHVRHPAPPRRRPMKIEEKQILPKDRIIARLREIADALEGGSFELGGRAVQLPDAAELEVEYKTKKGKEELEIEIEWVNRTVVSDAASRKKGAAASEPPSDDKVRTLE